MENRETLLPLTIGAVLAVLLHIAAVPMLGALLRGDSAAWTWSQPGADAISSVKPVTGKAAAIEPVSVEPPEPLEPSDATPPEKQPPEPPREKAEAEDKVKLGKDDAPPRATVAWISYEDFQALRAPKGRTEQPAVQKDVPPTPNAAVVESPTPPAPVTPPSQPKMARAAPPVPRTEPVPRDAPPVAAVDSRPESGPQDQPSEPTQSKAADPLRQPPRPQAASRSPSRWSRPSRRSRWINAQPTRPSPSSTSNRQNRRGPHRPIPLMIRTSRQSRTPAKRHSSGPKASRCSSKRPARLVWSMPTLTRQARPQRRTRRCARRKGSSTPKAPALAKTPCPPARVRPTRRSPIATATRWTKPRPTLPSPPMATPPDKSNRGATDPADAGKPLDQEKAQAPETADPNARPVEGDGVKTPPPSPTQPPKPDEAQPRLAMKTPRDTTPTEPVENPTQPGPTPRDEKTTQPSPQPQPARPTSAPLDEKESPPSTVVLDSPKVEPGAVVTGRGIEIKTAHPRFSIASLLVSAPSNPRVSITFNAKGRVTHAEFLRSTGYANVDSPILASLYKWEAGGEMLEKRGRPFTIEVQLILRR